MMPVDAEYRNDENAVAVTNDHQHECEVLAHQVVRLGWEVVSSVHSRTGVELHLHPASHVWDFPTLGRRVVYGRDDQDALRRFVRLLGDEQAAGD
jgi:hypothetical protein